MRLPIHVGEQTIVTAASLMPSDRTITVNIAGNGGTAWNCQADGCLAHENGQPRQAAHGIVRSTTADRLWDATYELGAPTTAALPATSSSSGHN